MPRYDFRAPRLYVEHPLDADSLAPLNLEQANYLRNVLRLRMGDAVLAFNGQDGEWRCRLAELGKKKFALRAEESIRAQTPLPPLDYCFAPLKHARLDYIVQKAVEMGASRLKPIMTRRTQAGRVNVARMRANAVEAAEQCGVLHIPEIADEISFDAFIKKWPAGKTLIFCDEDAPVQAPAEAFAQARLSSQEGFGLLVGPEGGFDESERSALLAQGNILRLSLGPRILRADTAGVAALALLQSFVGDWREI